MIARVQTMKDIITKIEEAHRKGDEAAACTWLRELADRAQSLIVDIEMAGFPK